MRFHPPPPGLARAGSRVDVHVRTARGVLDAMLLPASCLSMRVGAQPGVQPDAPVRYFYLASVGAARRLTCIVGPHSSLIVVLGDSACDDESCWLRPTSVLPGGASYGSSAQLARSPRASGGVVAGAPCSRSSQRLISTAERSPSRRLQSWRWQRGSASAIVLRHALRFAICQSPPRVAQPGVRADAPANDFYLAVVVAARRSTYTLGPNKPAFGHGSTA